MRVDIAMVLHTRSCLLVRDLIVQSMINETRSTRNAFLRSNHFACKLIIESSSTWAYVYFFSSVSNLFPKKMALLYVGVCVCVLCAHSLSLSLSLCFSIIYYLLIKCLCKLLVSFTSKLFLMKSFALSIER